VMRTSGRQVFARPSPKAVRDDIRKILVRHAEWMHRTGLRPGVVGPSVAVEARYTKQSVRTTSHSHHPSCGPCVVARLAPRFHCRSAHAKCLFRFAFTLPETVVNAGPVAAIAAKRHHAINVSSSSVDRFSKSPQCCLRKASAARAPRPCRRIRNSHSGSSLLRGPRP
jgi:hypothetical protein